MRAFVSSFLVAVLLTVSFPYPAQAQQNAWQPCNPEEKAALRLVMPGYVDRYKNISDRIGPIDLDDFELGTDDVDELIGDMHDLQVEWWQYVDPDLPHCVLAIELSSTMGRLFDETLIALLLLDTGYYSFADWHADPILELSADLAGLLNELNEPVAYYPTVRGAGP